MCFLIPRSTFSLNGEGFFYEVFHGSEPRSKGVRSTMSTGKVKWFNEQKGFGFITPDDGSDDLFVHHTSIIAEGYRVLQEEQEVEYEEGQGRKGPCATNVKPI